MKIGLIGPTNINLISSVSGIPTSVYINTAEKIGKIIAKYHHELVVIPNKGIALEGIRSYKKYCGEKITGITLSNDSTELHKDDYEYQSALSYCNDIIESTNWETRYSKICELSDLIICCGISCGTISVIAWTKWIQKPTVYVCENTITNIPPELTVETNIRLIENADALEDVLKYLYKEKDLSII